MVYTEYFVRGQQPTETCPLHEGDGLLGKFAGLFGKDGPPPTPAARPVLPPARNRGTPAVDRRAAPRRPPEIAETG